MGHQPKQIYGFGHYRLDAAERLLLRDGEVVPLQPKVFDLLLALVERHGRLLEKDELMKLVWPDTVVEEANLANNISQLRKAMGDGVKGQRYIETAPKRGYRFVAQVREVNGAGEPVSKEQLATQNITANAAPAANGGELSAPLATLSVMPLTIDAKRHKRGVMSLLVILALAVAGGGFGVYRLISPPQSRVAGPPIRVIPFTTYPRNQGPPAFSPDGNQIAFVWDGEKGDNVDIYVKLVDGGEPLRLTTHPGQDVSLAWGPAAIVARSPGDGNHPSQGVAPAWAPDGRSIAFLRRSPEWNGYFRISALGGAERFIAGGKARSRGFTWAPDGKALLVAEELLPDEPAAIYSIAVETGERKKLITAPQGKYYAGPTVSPDGKSILFLQSNLQAIDGGGIYVMGIDGGEPRLVVAVNGLERGHTWSADGSEIIFATSQSQAGPDGDLWRVPVSGGAPEPIGVGMNAASPVVARQGGRLAYLQRFIERTIYRMPVPSPGVPNSPPAKFIYSTHREYAPQYSPDGKRIAFHSDRTGNHEIWLCDSEGLNPAQLTFFGKGTAGTPRWSPDGRKIVFDLRSEGEADIYVISADGGAPRRLTNEPSEDMVPSWSHDGRWIYFCSDRSGRQQIWKMSPDGGPPIQLTRQGGFDGFESSDGKFLYYAKRRNMPSIWKVPVDGGEETPVVETDKPAQWRNWALSDQGIFFLNSDQPEKTVVEFFSFTTRQVTKLATLDRPTFLTGIALSPDGRWLLFTLTDRQGANIMLVENFR